MVMLKFGTFDEILLFGVLRKSFDIENGPMFDLASPQGFLYALEQTLRLKPGSLLFGGVPCSFVVTWFQKWVLDMFILGVLVIKDIHYIYKYINSFIYIYIYLQLYIYSVIYIYLHIYGTTPKHHAFTYLHKPAAASGGFG